MMPQRFRNKTVLVTGAASGIGRAVAFRLHGEGAQVILADRNAEGLEAVKSDLGASTAQTLVYDASDPASCMEMTQQAASVFDGLDVVINNAGTYRKSHFADISPAEWAQMLAINLSGHIWVTQAALSALETSHGNVVMTASTAAQHGNAYAAHYAAAKGGIVSVVKTLAVELAPLGIRVNAVCPGRVNTAIGDDMTPIANPDPALLVRPPKLSGHTDGGSPDDLAGAYAYLASSDAAYVSGAVLTVDGAQNIG